MNTNQEWKGLQTGDKVKVWYLTDYVYAVVIDKIAQDGHMFYKLGDINGSDDYRWFNDEGVPVAWSSR